jgi:hypothetical protein
VLQAHRRFAGFVEPWRERCARIVRIRSRHPRRERRGRLRRKRILVVVILSLSGRLGIRRLGSLRLRRRRLWRGSFLLLRAHARTQKKNRGHGHGGQTQIHAVHSVHRFSSEDFFSGSDGFLSNIDCIILISAR